KLLPEDYLTCLAEDDQGVIWIGTRQNGFFIADSKTGVRTRVNNFWGGVHKSFKLCGEGKYFVRVTNNFKLFTH
ncbi:MAG: hypothetical protein LBC74_15820, partial [Planctomycetaceae bacterium]|nr:hypothetical protein [Planctomycetaceae bacterium]